MQLVQQNNKNNILKVKIKMDVKITIVIIFVVILILIFGTASMFEVSRSYMNTPLNLSFSVNIDNETRQLIQEINSNEIKNYIKFE